MLQKIKTLVNRALDYINPPLVTYDEGWGGLKTTDVFVSPIDTSRWGFLDKTDKGWGLFAFDGSIIQDYKRKGDAERGAERRGLQLA